MAIVFDEAEIKFTFIRAQGPGGQNVNKVSTAVLLRFNVLHSPSLPEDLRQRLLLRLAKKITQQGDLLIKAGRYRTQERNKQDAIERLHELLRSAAFIAKKRRKTKPTFASKQRRLKTKKLQGQTKSLRRSKPIDE